MPTTDLRRPRMRSMLGRVVAVAAAFAAGWAAAPPAAAGRQAWTPIGPPGGTFASVAGASGSPETILAATDAGVIWRSSDGGQTWGLAGAAYGGQSGPRLAIDPSRSATVYASTQPSGVFKSTDGGATWRQLAAGLTGLAIAPGAPQTLYATQLVNGPFPGPQTLLIETSADAGASWSIAGGLPQGWPAAALAVDPTAAATVYALGKTGVARSTDGGVHWTLLFSPYRPGDFPLALIVDPRHPATLYIASQQLPGDGGASVWRSGNAGASWTAADAGLPRPLYSLALAPSGSLYAAAAVPGGTQVFTSADGGATWQQTAALVGVIAQVVAGPQSPDRLFALAYRGGLLASQDQGHTWAAPASPPNGSYVIQVLAGPAPNGELYVADLSAPAPFQRSLDGGATWSQLASPPQQDLPHLVLDAQPGRLYAAASLVAAPAAFSVDDGASWQALPTPGGLNAAFGIVANPASPGKLLELACHSSFGPPHGPGTCDSYSLFRSSTYGLHWRLLGSLGQGGAAAGFVRLDPANPTTAYAMVGGTLYKTTAGRPDLHPLPLRGPVADLAVDPVTPSTLYAAIDARRPVFKSTDGGARWAPASAGLPRGALSPVLAIDSIAPSTLYLGTSQGVFVSDDGAATWQPLGEGLAVLGVTSLAVSPTAHRTLFAGTPWAGAFSLTRP